ncbi:MAG: WD40/YVTN/BNR-like repeat-containing protein, partial [Polyangiales bacterium]
MFPPPKPEDDDVIGLPALPPVGQDEELATELGLETDFGEETTASLDDSTAADLFDPGSFLSFDDGPSVLGDAAVGGLEDSYSLPQTGHESEYGYTEDDEPVKDLELGAELVSTVPLSGVDDGGAEGLEDLVSLSFDGDDSLAGLAPILLDADDDGEEALMEELDLSLPLEYKFEEPRAPSTLPPKGEASVRWPLAEACNAIAIGPEDLIVAGALQLFARRGQDKWERLRAAGLEDAEVISLAFHRGALVAGTRLKGVFISADGGASFEPRNGWCGGQQPAVPCRVLVDGSERLWMTSGGALYRSEDATRWLGPLLPIPVSSIAADGEGAAALALGDDGATLFVSADGVRWARRSLEVKAAEG